jgi:hypothetical protein
MTDRDDSEIYDPTTEVDGIRERDDGTLEVSDPSIAAMYHLMDARREANDALDTDSLTDDEAQDVQQIVDRITDVLQDVDERLQEHDR